MWMNQIINFSDLSITNIEFLNMCSQEYSCYVQNNLLIFITFIYPTKHLLCREQTCGIG